MVLVGEKRAAFQFQSAQAGSLVIAGFSAFRLPSSRKREISSATNSLSRLAVDVSNFFGAALILTVLLLFLFLLQEILFQREGFNALAVGQRICGNVGGIKPEKTVKHLNHTYGTVN